MNEQNQHASPGQRAWQRFKGNRAAVLSAWYLVLLLAIIYIALTLLADAMNAVLDPRLRAA